MRVNRLFLCLVLVPTALAALYFGFLAHDVYVSESQFVVNTDLDSPSSIVTLTVRAFSAEESQAINERLLKMSEDFVNRLNDRARNDLVRFATADVESAEKQQRAAVLTLSQYRNKQA